MKDIILCDIDGTVANNDHRQHYLQGNKDWEGFFSDLSNDVPIYPVINLVNEESIKGKKIIFLTGRPERYREPTQKWLERYFNFSLQILMRPNENKKNKLIAKEEIFSTNFSKNEISYVIDNDKELLNMWKAMGLKTVDVKDLTS